MADLFKLKIITPDKTFYEGDVEMVELTTTEGQIGIYARHIPLTAIVAPGVLTIHEGSEKREAALLSGFIQVLPEQVTIMAEIAEWPEEIDENRAMEAKVRAERRLKSGSAEVDMARAELALKRALVRLEVRE
ncbi:MAG: ATP synthase F1 subunit epsilon [Lachnospiraceae bacterium]|nr:ATP synthase F1 subunit epsilon [Lachnospiraceae bacterium]